MTNIYKFEIENDKHNIITLISSNDANEFNNKLNRIMSVDYMKTGVAITSYNIKKKVSLQTGTKVFYYDKNFK